MSNNKGKYAEGFNIQLINLFKELTQMYTENKDFKLVKNQIMILSQTNTYELPIQTFELHISPFREHLRNKNDDFFLEFDLSSTPISELNYIKEIWKTVGKDTKNAMWRYFIILDKLAEKYHSIN